MCLLILLLVSGCGLSLDDATSGSNGTAFTEADSKSQFDIYPQHTTFNVVGKFERSNYLCLDDTQKSIYIAMDNAAYLMTTGFISFGDCSKRDVELAYYALRNDRPEYFWIPSEYSLRTSGKKCELMFAKTESDWRYTKSERKTQEKLLKSEIGRFLESVKSHHSEYERELMAHDWLCEKIKYDKKALSNPDEKFYAWNIVGAFNQGKAVCEGYSRAMQVLMYAVGIDCSLVTGVTKEAHMWNTVKINGSWYNVDLTADDGDNSVYHFFFNVTDQYMKTVRTVNPHFSKMSENEISKGRFNLFLPKCNETSQNFHIVNSLYIASKDEIEATVVSMLCDAVRSGRRSVEFAVDPSLGFVFGEQDAAKFFRIERCISAANAELEVKQALRTYSYGGVNGAFGFMISW